MRWYTIFGTVCLGLCLSLSGCSGEPEGPAIGSAEMEEQIRQQDAAVAADESKL